MEEKTPVNEIDTTKLNEVDIITITKPKHAGGRPEEYTKELADKICSKLSEGLSLRTVCLDEDMPNKSTIFKWFREKPEFVDQYTRAKEESADADLEIIEDLGDKAIEESKLADPKAANAVVSAYKLKADNMKWAMSKKKPKKYGDKLDMSTNGKDLPSPIIFVNRDVSSDNSTTESN